MDIAGGITSEVFLVFTNSCPALEKLPADNEEIFLSLDALLIIAMYG